MRKTILLKKQASNKKIILRPTQEEQKIILLEYLKKIKKLPIASSCNGEGVCKKCIFNESLLLCEIKVKDSPKEIKISYL